MLKKLRSKVKVDKTFFASCDSCAVVLKITPIDEKQTHAFCPVCQRAQPFTKTKF